MNLLTETIEQLAQDKLRAGVDVNEPLGYADLLAQQSAKRRRVRVGVVVSAGHLGLGCSNRLVNGRKWILAQQKLDTLESPAAFFC